MDILIASKNNGKIKEIKEILNNVNLITLNDIKCDVEVIESGKTFEENAKKKAKELYDKYRIPCIADDSGIEIEIYNGWPGVKTARFLGKDKSSNEYAKERNEIILEKMKNKKREERKVKNITVIAYYDGNQFKIATGTLIGYIAEKRKGSNGFGFDEIFELENGKTLAELTAEEKNSISSRKQALEKLKNMLPI